MKLRNLYDNIRSACIDVYDHLGPGHSESIYHQAVLAEFRNRNIRYDSEVIFPVKYKYGHIVGHFRCDIVVREGSYVVIIELKAIGREIFKPNDGEILQIKKYINHTDINNGLLVNFPQRSSSKVVFQEFIGDK